MMGRHGKRQNQTYGLIAQAQAPSAPAICVFLAGSHKFYSQKVCRPRNRT